MAESDSGAKKLTAAELAREARLAVAQIENRLVIVESQFGNLNAVVQSFNPQEIRERIAVIEEKISQLEAQVQDVKRVAVLEDRVGKLEKNRDESEKRQWQFVYISAGRSPLSSSP